MFSGNLVNVIIPRPGPNGEPVPGVGKVICRDDAVSVLFKLFSIRSRVVDHCSITLNSSFFSNNHTIH